MNFIYFLKELWQRRLAVVLAAVVAAVIAALAVFNVSPSWMSLNKRDHVEAHGSIEILIDSARSPIADVGRDLEPLTARAGVFARYIAGGNVIKQISETTGIPVKQIEVAGPAPLPGEAIGATAPPTENRPYGFQIVQRDELPIVNVETRAPTVPEARELAAAAPAAIRGIVSEIQRTAANPGFQKGDLPRARAGPGQPHHRSTRDQGGGGNLRRALRPCGPAHPRHTPPGQRLARGRCRAPCRWAVRRVTHTSHRHCRETRRKPPALAPAEAIASERSWRCAAAAMADEAQVSRGELREATLEGVRWISATRLAFEIVAVAGAVVLAHLVPPAEYGRFAIALVIPEIALSLVNEGLGTPLFAPASCHPSAHRGHDGDRSGRRPRPDRADLLRRAA